MSEKKTADLFEAGIAGLDPDRSREFGHLAQVSLSWVERSGEIRIIVGDVASINRVCALLPREDFLEIRMVLCRTGELLEPGTRKVISSHPLRKRRKHAKG